MNILITLNSGYAAYAAVMLTSLIVNNDVDLNVFCLYRNLDESSKNLLRKTVERRAANNISFIYMDNEKCKLFKDFPTTDTLTIECYFLLMAHAFLPSNLDRILYLDSDLLVDGDIGGLYETSFDDKYIVVAGQSHKEINGHMYPLGARPKHGECFNSGVILFDLPKMRHDISSNVYSEMATRENYDFFLDQGILNLVFFDRAKYVDTMKYNFRMSIYHDYLEDGNADLELTPVIIHFACHDFYHIGHGTKPWICTLLESEYNFLESIGKVKKNYGMDEWVKKNEEIHDKFWAYAHLAGLYEKIYKSMRKHKKNILKVILGEKGWDYAELLQRYSKQQELFKHITCGAFSMVSADLDKYTYGELEQYIDTLSPDVAKRTLQNLHKLACQKISSKNKVSVGFLVYSSAEWQCDRLYWLLDKDDRFLPVILICGYGHGTTETVRDTYLRTCRYFKDSKKTYHIRYGGYLHNMYKDTAKDLDVLVYITPFSGLYPFNLNFQNRTLNQLGIHIPYGIYLVEKKIKYYKTNFYEMPIFKMGWRYFCEAFMQEQETKKAQRLEGFNILTTGMPKLDDLVEKSALPICDSWKCSDKTTLKIIWAPHFNMQKGMNSTFHENFKWLYEYAKKHIEISWIVRPHPRMAIGALEQKLFNSLEDYEKYMDKWNRLPNARVVHMGDYYSLFSTSDCMILDSITFLAEYQYTGKPLLWLLPEIPRPMNELGDKLKEVLYTCRGNAFKEIETFIDDIKNRRDKKKHMRKCFFSKYLDYYGNNKCLASDKIYETFVEYLT